MTVTEDVLNALALGAARSALTTPAGDDELSRSVGDAIAGRTAEDALLAAVAVVAAARRGGRRLAPLQPPQLPDPCAPDPRPSISDDAAAALTFLRDLVEPWYEALELVDRAGLRLPDAVLADLFDRSDGKPDRHRLALSLGGVRGRWLLEHSRRWRQLATQIDPASSWSAESQTPSRLRTARAQDPALGRSLVAALGDAVTASTLAGLDVGLGPDDEALLEQIVSAADPSTKAGASLRAAALRALRRIPTSARARRCAAVAERTVRSRRLVFRRELEVAAPRDPDLRQLADDIPDSPSVALAEHELGVWRAVASVPPSVLTLRLRCSAAELAGMARTSKPRSVVMAALASATFDHHDGAMAAALVEVHPMMGREPLRIIDPYNDFLGLAEITDHDELERILVRNVGAGPAAVETSGLAVLLGLRRRWRPPLVHALLQAIEARRFMSWTGALAMRCDLDCARDVELLAYRLVGTDHPAARSMEEAVAVVAARARFHREITA